MYIPFISGIGQHVLNMLQGVAEPIEAALGLSPSDETQNSLPMQVPTPGGGQALMSNIESAVVQALQSSPASATSNPNQIIQNAISQVLDNPNTAQTSTGNNNASLQSSFLQTLNQYGVDPQQFRQDLFAAMENSNGTTTNSAATSQLFPPGSLLNTMG